VNGNVVDPSGAACATVRYAHPTIRLDVHPGYNALVPEPDDLFGVAEPAAPREPNINRPLADRLRPVTLAEVVGQDHLLGPDGALTRMLERGSLRPVVRGIFRRC
jgi:hypothetical protein